MSWRGEGGQKGPKLWYIDRVPSFDYQLKLNLELSTTNISIFTILRHSLSHSDKVTKDRFILLITQKWPNIIWYGIQYSLWYSLWVQILRPRTIIFLLHLLFDLGYRALRFASMTNLEAVPLFAKIWILLLQGISLQIRQNRTC